MAAEIRRTPDRGQGINICRVQLVVRACRPGDARSRPDGLIWRGRPAVVIERRPWRLWLERSTVVEVLISEHVPVTRAEVRMKVFWCERRPFWSMKEALHARHVLSVVLIHWNSSPKNSDQFGSSLARVIHLIVELTSECCPGGAGIQRPVFSNVDVWNVAEKMKGLHFEGLD